MTDKDVEQTIKEIKDERYRIESSISGNLLVIASANACAQPDAVVVKFHHTVVTDVAVRCTSRPEDIACLTELELVQHR